MMSEDKFDQLLSEIQNEAISEPEAQAAKARVRARLDEVSKLSGPCAEFRPDLPAYVGGRLSDSRRLLVEDHLGRCAGCRKALAALNGDAKVISIESVRRVSGWQRYGKWAMAAGVAAIALFAGRERIDQFLAPGGPRATVVQVAGTLMRLPGEAMPVGAALNEGDVVRTGQGSRARLRLADGSLMEINERSELSITAKWSGQDVHLERGDVIVEAAKQRRGFLRVVTHDSVASVKGTVFAVSAGSSGSLVTVVEGAVQVDQAAGSRLVKPAEQAASSPALHNVTAKEAVSWSENREKYLGVLGELAKLEKELAALPSPSLRTQAKLLPLLPANVVAYVAIPNLGGTIDEGLRLIEQRAATNPILKEWWADRDLVEMKRIFQELSAVSPMIGDEIVFALAQRDGRDSVPLLLTEVKAGQRAALETKINGWLKQENARLGLNLTDNLLMLTGSPADLAWLQANAQPDNAFAAEIRQRYARGAGWLVGVNLENALGARGAKGPEWLGAGDVRHLFLEQRNAGSRTENSAVLTFRQARQGIASWLAEPGSIGSAEYVSSQATMAMAASTKDPRIAFDELLTLMGRVSPGTIENLRDFEKQTGVSLANDIAAALGTDFTIAIETPKIPIPGWTLAIEAYRPESIVSAFERFAQAYNAKQSDAKLKVTVRRERANGRDWTTIGIGPVSFDLTFDRGYLVAGADRGLVSRAIQTRQSGFSLPRSAAFRQQLPDGGGLHSSAFVWVNTQSTLKDVLGLIDNASLQQLLNSREPVLILLNGERERIAAISRNRFTSLLFDTILATEGDSKPKAKAPAKPDQAD